MSKEIKCDICGINMIFERLPRHINTTHKKDINNWEEYLNKYIDNIPNYNRCVICNTICIKRVNITCSKECQSKYYSNTHIGIMTGVPKSENHKKNISISKKEKYANGSIKKRYVKLSQQTKDKISQSAKIRIAKDGHPRTGTYHTQKTKDLIGKIASEAFKMDQENHIG